LRAVVVLPIVLPPVVGGVGLLVALGRNGMVGRWLHDALGFQLTFTTAGAVVATTFVSMPLVVLATEAGLRGLDRRHERAAAAMGAGAGARLGGGGAGGGAAGALGGGVGGARGAAPAGPRRRVPRRGGRGRARRDRGAPGSERRRPGGDRRGDRRARPHRERQ